MNNITAICVVHNTKDLFQNAYESFRKWHSEMMIVIVDGSDYNDPCRRYIESLNSPYTTLVLCQSNIGHGRGMDAGIKLVKTKFALLFDSDTVMLKSPVEQMLAMMEEDTYGVGAFDYVDNRGFGMNNHTQEWRDNATKYLHPYFQLINVEIYKRFPPYIHHGAPCFMAMNEIRRQGLSGKILKEFPGASIYGNEFIKHNTDGTRSERRRRGKPEIEGGWDRNESRRSRSGNLFK
jgi:GT2 family glycosyltransferase